MVDAIRTQPASSPIDPAILGTVQYGTSGEDRKSVQFRRSLFAVQDIRAGETFTKDNVRIIRPGHGLPPKEIGNVIGKTAAVSIKRGTPLALNMLA